MRSGRTILLIALTALLAGVEGLRAQGPDAAGALRPGDVVRVAVSGEDALSGDYTVGPDGKVSLPLIGTQTVTNSPPDRLRQELLDAFNAQFRNQSIEVTLLRRIRVLGAVQKPGLYHADPTMTLADVVALAGGATATGRLTEARIIRDGREIHAEFGTSAGAATELQSGDQVFVPEKSWVSRNATWVIGVSLSVAAIITRALY